MNDPAHFLFTGGAESATKGWQLNAWLGIAISAAISIPFTPVIVWAFRKHIDHLAKGLSSRYPRLRRWLNPGEKMQLIASGVIVWVFLAAAVFAFVLALAPPPGGHEAPQATPRLKEDISPPATQVNRFTPTYVHRKEAQLRSADWSVTCWDRSLRSPRKDAMSCDRMSLFSDGPFYDPCFLVDNTSVACFVPSLAADYHEASVQRVEEILPAGDAFSDDDLVGMDNIVARSDPWLLKLDRQDDLGNDVWCSMNISESRLAATQYTCSASGIASGRLAEGILDGSVDLSFPGRHGLKAIDLERSEDTWTIELADEATSHFREVVILEAWF